jgi:hypothetical protein
LSSPVPRFFFHLYDDLVSRDAEGVELADRQAAEEKAVESAREVAAAQVLNGHLDLSHRIEVEDEAGEIVIMVPFGDVVSIAPQAHRPAFTRS